MKPRALSGMRPTGALHIGHLLGVISNWRKMQDAMDCYFFVADWHALTTDYAAPGDSAAAARAMVTAWLAAGIDQRKAVLFIQSHIPEHAELHILLSMFCPLPKLMQLPTYKEQKENLNRDLDTCGFLAYPLLQSADILMYRPQQVPVGEDQLPHIEFTREIARRFNFLYGGGAEFTAAVGALLRRLPPDTRAALESARRRYQQSGDEAALAEARARIDALSQLSEQQRRQLRGYCAYGAEELLPLPQAGLTPAAKVPGTDGRKMSKSYNNTIDMFDADDIIAKKLARMTTDPARQRRSDKGNPDNCPVWDLHAHFSDAMLRQEINAGCRSAAIGCVDCKKTLAAGMGAALAPLRARRADIEKSGDIDDIIADGNRRARAAAAETLSLARAAMRLMPPL